MSKIALSGNASGTGTFTIASPDSNSDRTLNLPDNSGTLVTNTSGSVSQAMLASGVAGTGPAFSAYQSSAQSFSQTTFTKVSFQTEEFDTASCFDNASTYRFTPNVAGYYQVTGAVAWNSPTAVLCQIHKNGDAIRRGLFENNAFSSFVSALIYLNGLTDYVELYGYQAGATQNAEATALRTYFQAALVRAA
jgi:hypothetical protein